LRRRIQHYLSGFSLMQVYRKVFEITISRYNDVCI
jgi:hypothetical protein